MEPLGTGTHGAMEPRRNTWRDTWEAAIRLAAAWSVLATAIAVMLSAAGLAQSTIVLGVIVVGFALSWVRTGQAARSHDHRAVTVPVRGTHAPVG